MENKCTPRERPGRLFRDLQPFLFLLPREQTQPFQASLPEIVALIKADAFKIPTIRHR